MKTILSISFLVIAIILHGQVIPKDKQLHIGAGAVVAGWGTMIPQNNTGWKPFIYGAGASVIAGAGKELADMGGFGTPDIKDFGATVISGIVTAGVITGVKAIIHKRHGRNKMYAKIEMHQKATVKSKTQKGRKF